MADNVVKIFGGDDRRNLHLAERIMEVVSDYAVSNHMTSSNIIGVLETCKLNIYITQAASEIDVD